ncbi:mediator of RNA polymerase II transcription subunit 15a-like [Telopea speciosissima]|uniref:mediator of RNA polymerase II transcription subunit 15a-like n=1 Tax=Telopea speciosissima TaxID=54955 RepID=UPI001CC42CC0|nr:mediator of RNA polymerase II transcription subunit 15a-like [Telopea speciosissima]
MDTSDWRTQLQPDSRQRILNKIMETLKRNRPISGPEGLEELRKIAVRFEAGVYSAAASQTDYLRKISLKMLAVETKSQTPGVAGSLQSNPVVGNQNPPDPASIDSIAQTGLICDWQEEVYQKIKAMKEMYLPELDEMYQKIAIKLQQVPFFWSLDSILFILYKCSTKC